MCCASSTSYVRTKGPPICTRHAPCRSPRKGLKRYGSVRISATLRLRIAYLAGSRLASFRIALRTDGFISIRYVKVSSEILDGDGRFCTNPLELKEILLGNPEIFRHHAAHERLHLRAHTQAVRLAEPTKLRVRRRIHVERLEGHTVESYVMLFNSFDSETTRPTSASK